MSDESLPEARQPSGEQLSALSPSERARALSGAIARHADDGFEVLDRDNESGTAILRRPAKRVNHILHLLLSILTAGLWLFVWLFLTIFHRREKRVFVTVRDDGSVSLNTRGGMSRWVVAGTVVLVGVIVVFVIAAVAGSGDSEVPANGSQAAGREQTAPGIGDVVTVGSLELTVLSAEGYDSTQHNTFNDSNYRVQVRVRKHRGEEYDFSLFSQFTVIDTSGVGHDADLVCASCPDNLFEGGGLTLYGDNSVVRYVYFSVPDPGAALELRYEPLLSLTEAVRIQLR